MGKEMNTKILLGSIGAVAILILVSFTNVVNVQSTTSDSVNNSPLFSIRTRKAINEESQGDLTSNYLGKGNELKVFIPSGNNEKMLLRKAINRLQGMDDATFTKFLENGLRWLMTQERYKDVNVLRLISDLHRIKENPEIFERYFANHYEDLTAGDIPSVYVWFPGCNLLKGIAIIILGILIFILWTIFPTTAITCSYCPLLYL